MSIESYRRNVKRRVAGPHLPICFPAALEQVSPHHSYRPNIYPYYKEFSDWHWNIPRVKRDDYNDEFAEMLNKLVRPLGMDSWEEVTFKRAKTALGFARIVKKLLQDDYRVVAEVTYSGPAKNGLHAVGILPIGEEGYVHLVSNHVHKTLRGIVSLRQVGEHIGVVSDDKHYDAYPFNDANITALPPID